MQEKKLVVFLLRAIFFAIGGTLIMMSLYFIMGAGSNQMGGIFMGAILAFVGFFVAGQALFEEEVISNE